MTDLAQGLAFLSDEDNKSPVEDLDDSDVAEMELEAARRSPAPPSSPELHCVGCDISSKADCPVEKLKKRKCGDNGESPVGQDLHTQCVEDGQERMPLQDNNIKEMW